MSAPLERGYLNSVVNAPDGLAIDFGRIPGVRIAAKNINRCAITGLIGPAHDFNRCNITSSTLDSVRALGANFLHVDFKDCLILDSAFTRTNFDGLAFVNNAVLRTVFEGCTFNDTSITESEFVDCSFNDCDFTNLLIKGCRFLRCVFVDCVTSNKLFEMCLVLECNFVRTALQLQTLTSNFGLVAERMTDSPVRSRDPKMDYVFLHLSDIASGASSEGEFSPLERFRLAYFLSPDLVWGSEVLDAALDVRSWIQLCRIPTTFALLLEDFSDFLLHLYDTSRLTLHPILLLHTTTSQLSATPENDVTTSPRVSRSVMGVHMVLSRTIENFLKVVDELIAAADERIRFVANGPLDPNFYLTELAHVFVGGEVQLVDVKPHNSPVEIVFRWISSHGLTCLLAAFAASRVKVDVDRLYQEVANPVGENRKLASGRAGARSKRRRRALVPPKRTQLFSYSMGFKSANTDTYEVKARALLPGSLLVQLRLDVSTSVLQKFRRILVELIAPREVAK